MSIDAKLPSNAVLVKETDVAIWDDEVLEFNGLVNDPDVPYGLQAYLRSFKADDGTFVHAFDGSGVPLSQFEDEAVKEDDDGCPVLNDAKRLRLIVGLLEAVNFLHNRGSAHLGLDASSIRIAPLDVNKPDPDDLELRIIGLGAAVKLGKWRVNFMVDENIPFHAPELLEASLMASSLGSLISWMLVVEPASMLKLGSQSAIEADVRAFIRQYAENKKIDESEIKFLKQDEIKF
jgi:hypothetical protein